jgi:hypothetical protein
MADQSDIPYRPEYMLTTYDNPFDPWTQWDEWYVWDMTHGYNTPGLLERVSNLPEDAAEVDMQLALSQAIDEIVRENVSGMHTKVKQGDKAVATG